jgi:hypothetical protein
MSKFTLLFFLISITIFSSAQDVFKEKYFKKDNTFFHLKSKDTLITYTIATATSHHYSLNYITDTTFLVYKTEKLYEGKKSAVKISNNEILLYSLKQVNHFIKVPELSNSDANYMLNNYLLGGCILNTLNESNNLEYYTGYNFYSFYQNYNDSIYLYQPKEVFKPFITEKIKTLNDSLKERNNQILIFSNSLQEKLNVNNYIAFKDSIFILLSDTMSLKCFDQKINYLIVNHPESYLKLIEEKPEYQTHLINYLFLKRSNLKKLKTVSGHEKALKLFKSEYRKDRLRKTLIISALSAYHIALFGGIYYLIVR